MAITRREMLSGIAKAGVPAAVAITVVAGSGEEAPKVPSAAVGLLYDATLCIGCKACVAAARKRMTRRRTHVETRCTRRPAI